MDGDAAWDNSEAVVAALQPISRCPAYPLLPQILASASKFLSLLSCFVLLHWPKLFPYSLPQALSALKMPQGSEL